MARDPTEMRRVLVTVNETSSVPDLWHVVTEHLAGENTELLIVFLKSDRWRRAASLPFTREILRVSGISSKFTPTRAEQVDKEIIARIRDRLQQFATEARVPYAFEVFSEQEVVRIHELLTSESDVLIVPSFFKGLPVYDEIARLKCRIHYVEMTEAPAHRRL